MTETWYATTTDADAEQNALNTIHYAYDAAGRIVSESDDDSSNTYTYDEQGRLVTVTEESVLGPPVVLSYTYEGDSTRPSSMTTSIDGTADFLNTYEYDSDGNLIEITQTGQTGGNAVAEKEIDLTYNASGQVESITRYLDSQLVVVADYDYDSAGRLIELVYHQGATILASYTWTYSGDGSGVLSVGVPSDTWLPNGGLPIIGSVGAGEGMLPVNDTADIATALWVGNYWGDANLLTSATSSDGTVSYTYDQTGQLIGADYSGGQPNESYIYDANGNRTNPGYVIGDGNRLLSDGTYAYAYDEDGNRTARFIDVDEDGLLDTGDTDITQYTWDSRHRLASVTDYATFADIAAASATQIVTYLYDVENRWIGETIDSDGDGTVDHQTRFVYDGNQIVLQFDKDGTGDVTADDLSHRYLWGPAVDQALADEQVTNPQTAGNVVWPLTDNLGTVRDLAIRDPQTGATSVANHRVYDSFGNLKSQTNATVDCLFGFTGRPFDEATGLQNNTNRWYDAKTGRWMSNDSIGLHGGDMNVYRYVGNDPVEQLDPSGLSPWSGIAKILGYKWGGETCGRAAKRLATELLGRLKGLHPNSPKAQEVIRALKKMGWVEESLGKGQHAGQGLILREMENGKPTGRFLQWHPGGGHHGPDPYWKFTSGETDQIRMGPTGIMLSLVPGAAALSEGRLNDAAREVAVEATPLRWASWLAAPFEWLYDWACGDLEAAKNDKIKF